MLAPDLSVAENVFMGQELKTKSGFISLRQQEELTQCYLDQYKLNISASAPLVSFTIAEQQMVEIIRAVSFGSRIIVMDEPTSSLSNQEVEILYAMIRRLKAEGVGIIYISHRLNELFEISDRVMVMRDGMYIDTVETAATDREKLVAMMVGRELSSYYSKTQTVTDQVVLEVENISDGRKVKNVSFTLRAGEVLGIAGLVGAGRSEAMKCIFGLASCTSGTIRLHGKPVQFKNPREAMQEGIALVPEDRKVEGLFLQQDIRYNSTITVLGQFLNHIKYDSRLESSLVEENIKKCRSKPLA